MEATAGGLAETVNGQVMGQEDRRVTHATAFKSADADAVTFLKESVPLSELLNHPAGTVVIGLDRLDDVTKELQESHSLILVDDPQTAFVDILQQFRPPPRQRPPAGISPAAAVAESARIGKSTSVRPGAVIEDDVVIGERCLIHGGVVIGAGTTIGDDVVLHPSVVIYADVEIGNRVIIHASSVIGADGFGYRFKNGCYEKVPQLGRVRIEDDVEIGACTTIDRGTIDSTVVAEGTKLDNLIMIAHNCEIGRHNAFASQVGLAGSTTTGDFVQCGGQAGISDHRQIGTGSSIAARSAVTRDIPEGETWFGFPARPAEEAYRIIAAQPKLPSLLSRIRKLEKQLEHTTGELEALRELRDKAA